jgi:hypothetical protein
LITAAYWRLVSQAQTGGTADKAAEIAVYHLTRSYQVLADPHSRAAYDATLGISSADTAPPDVPARRRSSWVAALWQGGPDGKPMPDAEVDYYELLRVDPLANPAIVEEAYTSMRNCYLRLAELGQARPAVVDLLEEAHAVIADPERRRLYDRSRKKAKLSPPGNGHAANPAGEKSPPSKPDARRPGRESAANEAKANATAKSSAANRLKAKASPKVASVTTQARTKTSAKAPRVVREKDKPAKESQKRAGSPKAVEPRPVSARRENGRSAWRTEEEEGIEAAATLRVVKSLAVGSASVLGRGGKKSINLARRASQFLRDILLDVEPQTADGLSPEEEEALMERLSQMPETAASVDREAPSARPGPLARLTLIGGPGLGREFAVEAVPFTLGDDPGCDVALPGLSPQHARLLHQNGHFVLYSLSEEPGTSIHGESMAWAVLQNGDSFEIGPYQMRFDAGPAPATQS